MVQLFLNDPVSVFWLLCINEIISKLKWRGKPLTRFSLETRFDLRFDLGCF